MCGDDNHRKVWGMSQPAIFLGDAVDITIRSFRPEDLNRIKQITAEAFDGVSIDRNIEERFGVINDRDWRWRKTRHIDNDVNREPAGIFVAQIASEVVGYVTTWTDRDASIGYIPNLAVASDRRGEGIGRRLLEHALDHFRHSGLSLARIETLDQNSIGQQLYPSLGFQEVARQVHYCMSLDADERLKSK